MIYAIRQVLPSALLLLRANELAPTKMSAPGHMVHYDCFRMVVVLQQPDDWSRLVNCNHNSTQ